jgi:hypothetical protein
MGTRLLEREWPMLVRELPAGWKESAFLAGAIVMEDGPLADPEKLLRLLLGRAASDGSLRSVVAHARATGLCDVSNVALHKREKRCADWLEWIVDDMLAETMAGLPSSPLRMRLVDATCASRPGSTMADFRLHVTVELPTRRFTRAELTDNHGGESFERMAVEPGDLLVGDRIYGTTNSIEHVTARGGYALVRINASSLPMWSTSDGARVDPLVVARRLVPGEMTEIPVEIRPKSGHQAIEGRFCIYALPTEQAAKAQKRTRRTKLKRGKRPGKCSIESAKYIMLFTTVPCKMMTTAQVVATYRLRWQVELAFKTLKTVLKFDELPNRLPDTGRTWLLAKLICALLLQRLASRHEAIPPSDVAAAA